MTNRALISAVVIGRNEARTLHDAIASVQRQVDHVCYVDSQSDDGSREIAAALGVEVVELTGRLSAARARNVGADCIHKQCGDASFVQFVDGDCTLLDGWVEAGLEAFHADESLAVVAGRVFEKERDASIYSRLCDLEWGRDAGKVDYVGGIFLARLDAFREVGGFDPSVLAGEEPEFCHRIRQAGWSVWRLDVPMARHDSGIATFRGWWRRAIRSGYAMANAYWEQGDPGKPLKRREYYSVLVWTIGVMLITLGLTLAVGPLGLCGLLVWPIQALRIAIGKWRTGEAGGDALLYGLFILLAKFGELWGIFTYRYGRPRSAGVSSAQLPSESAK